jgi:hypothetical protein
VIASTSFGRCDFKCSVKASRSTTGATSLPSSAQKPLRYCFRTHLSILTHLRDFRGTVYATLVLPAKFNLFALRMEQLWFVACKRYAFLNSSLNLVMDRPQRRGPWTSGCPAPLSPRDMLRAFRHQAHVSLRLTIICDATLIRTEYGLRSAEEDFLLYTFDTL